MTLLSAAMEMGDVMTPEEIDLIFDHNCTVIGQDEVLERDAFRGVMESVLKQRAEVAEPREAVIAECREVVLSCSDDAHEAAKAKDATDYVGGYQDAVVDCDEALRHLLQLDMNRESS